MRSYEAEPAAVDRDAENGWEVVPHPGGISLEGVRVAGFRDRTAAGLDMQVLPQPAVIVIIGLGDDPVTVESATGHQPRRSFVAAMSSGPARVRGERVECIEMCLSPRPPMHCWASPTRTGRFRHRS
jgi:hypothetical protein